jgi:hypothetical protein
MERSNQPRRRLPADMPSITQSLHLKAVYLPVWPHSDMTAPVDQKFL